MSSTLPESFLEKLTAKLSAAGLPEPLTNSFAEIYQTNDHSEEFCPYGQCGDDVYWAVIDYVLYIGGMGDMWDFVTDELDENTEKTMGPPWMCVEYGRVTILDGVTSIGKNAFYNDTFDSISIPASVHTIKEGAFYETSLTELELPATIQTIETGIICSDPCRVDRLIVAADLPDIAPEAFYTRYLGPDEITLTGALPEDLSMLVRSCLFVWPCEKINYPDIWDKDGDSFFDKLSHEIRKQGAQDDFLAYDDEGFDNLKRALTPYHSPHTPN